MTQEEKDLLLKDLCARLPYGVKVQVDNEICILGELDCEESSCGITHTDGHYSGADIEEEVRPFLRPMSSMTEEEKRRMLTIFERPCEKPKLEVDEYYGIRYTKYAEDHRIIDMYYDSEQQAEWLDWLNAHHFDYRGLIPMDLALEAPEGMYKTN